MRVGLVGGLPELARAHQRREPVAAVGRFLAVRDEPAKLSVRLSSRPRLLVSASTSATDWVITIACPWCCGRAAGSQRRVGGGLDDRAELVEQQRPRADVLPGGGVQVGERELVIAAASSGIVVGVGAPHHHRALRASLRSG